MSCNLPNAYHVATHSWGYRKSTPLELVRTSDSKTLVLLELYSGRISSLLEKYALYWKPAIVVFRCGNLAIHRSILQALRLLCCLRGLIISFSFLFVNKLKAFKLCFLWRERVRERRGEDRSLFHRLCFCGVCHFLGENERGWKLHFQNLALLEARNKINTR